MVVFPLAIDAVNFASLWVLYSFQSEDSFQFSFPDFYRPLGSTCQQLEKTLHYYLLQELARFGQKTFSSSRLSGDIFLLILQVYPLIENFL